jgi:hypothetical protein
MKKLLGLLSSGAMAATIVAVAGSASAATVLSDNMGTLLANKSLPDSIVMTYTPPHPGTGSNGTLVYSFGSGPSTTLTGLNASAANIDLTFNFNVVGQALTLTYADATNPNNTASNALVGSPYIYLFDNTTSTAVTAHAPFAAIPHALSAVTDTVTLQPGSYSETVIATLVKGTTDINVGAYAGPAVPEPATWSLMLFGVGAVGASLRSRRKMATVAA